MTPLPGMSVSSKASGCGVQVDRVRYFLVREISEDDDAVN